MRTQRCLPIPVVIHNASSERKESGQVKVKACPRPAGIDGRPRGIAIRGSHVGGAYPVRPKPLAVERRSAL
jgi:hypothetical protein